MERAPETVDQPIACFDDSARCDVSTDDTVSEVNRRRGDCGPFDRRILVQGERNSDEQRRPGRLLNQARKFGVQPFAGGAVYRPP